MPDSSTTPPILSFILTSDVLVPTSYTAGSLAEAVTHEPQGVYTLLRTFHGHQALLLDAHLDRLEQSAQLANITFQLDRKRLRAALRDLLKRANYPDARIRITIPQAEPGCIYLALEPYQPVPENVLQQGAQLSTTPLIRENPIIKATQWMSVRSPTYRNLPSGVYEGLLVTESGMLLEGLSSNFYSVLDGVLYTTGVGVLKGITRRAILTIAPDILPVVFKQLHVTDISRFSEAMLTSSSRGVVPVTVIDEVPVGNGVVGPIVTAIQQRYIAWTEENIKSI